MSLKNPVTPPGIDPGTVQLVPQCLNHYAIPGPDKCVLAFVNCEFISYYVILGTPINTCRLFKDVGSDTWFVYPTAGAN